MIYSKYILNKSLTQKTKMKFLIYPLKSIVFYFFICTLINNNYVAQCDYSIEMQDSYGDGWNGASIDIEVNGINITNITVSSGSSGSGSFTTYTDDIVDFIFNSGSWDSEITFQITDPSGEEIYDGAAPSIGVFLTHTSNSTCEPPSCMPPSFFSTANLTSNSVDLSWENAENSIYCNIQYGTTGFNLGAGIIDTSFSNNYSINNLSPVTTYDVYLQSFCDAEDSSTWAGPFSFSTACGEIIPPNLEDFEQGFPPNDCWNQANNGDPSTGPTDIGSSSWTVDGFANNSTTGAVKINLWLAEKNDWILSPLYDLSNGGPFQVEFDFGVFQYANNNSGTLGSDDQVQVLISNDGGSSWDTLAVYDNSYTTSNGGDHIIIPIAEENGIVQFAIWATEGSVDDTEDNDVIIDNFAVNEIPDCPILNNLNANNMTPNTVDINWIPGLSDSVWLVSYDILGYDVYNGTFTEFDTNSIVLQNLTPNTSYDVYVKSICETGDTNALIGPVSFTTLPACPIIENIVVSEIATNSAVINWTPGFSDSVWLVAFDTLGFDINNSNVIEIDTNYIMLDSLSPSTTYEFYVRNICLNGDTNSFEGPIEFTTLPEGVCGVYTLELYDSYGDGWNGAAINVIVNGENSETVTLNFGNGPETFEIFAVEGDIVEFSFTSGSWDSEVSFIITNPTGYEIYNGGAPNIGIFTSPVESCPSCPQPQNINTSNISFDMATLNWSSVATDSLWIVYLTPNGVTPDTSHQTITSVDSISYNGLTENTAYDFYVKEVCELGDTSILSGPYTFLTTCLPISAPYEQSFDNTVAPEIDQCWTIVNSNNDDYAFIRTDNSAFNPQLSAPNSVSFYNSLNNSGNLLLVSPQIIDLDSNKRIRFHAQNNGSQYNESDLIIGTISDPTDASTFSPYDTVLNNSFNSDQWQEIIVSFDKYDGVDNYIAIGHGMNYTYDYIWIDDFIYEEIPSCVAPTELTVSSITSDTAYLSWNYGGSDSIWLVYLVHDTSTLENVSPVISEFNNISLPIDPNTAYSFYVQGVCEIGDTSRLIGPHFFNTPCVSLNSLPYIEEFSIWPPNCWDLSGGTQTCVQYNNSAAQASFYSWTVGNNALMTSPVFDVSNLVSPELIFDWSHLYSSFYPNDGLEVSISDNNGASWTQVWYKTAEELESNDGASTYNPGSFVSSGRINLSSFGNSIIIRFNFISGYGPYCFIDNVEIKEAPLNDIGITNVEMPLASSGCEIAVSPLNVTIQNYGVAPQTQFSINYTLNEIPFSEIVFDTIQGGDTLVYTFLNDIDMSEDGSYEFIFSTNLENDSDADNNGYQALNFENFYSPPAVQGTHDTVCCVGDVAFLTASGPEDVTIDWFDSIGGNVLFSGNTFITPPLSTSTSYWAAYLDAYSSNVGPTDNSIGNGGYYNFNNGEGLIFDVFNEISLDSITIYAEELGEVGININNSSIGFNENISYEITEDLPFNGEVKIPIGIDLEPASNYSITLNEYPEGGLYRNTTGVNFPYTGDGNININGTTNGSNFYFYFYNWEISSVSCYSKHEKVIAYIDGIWGINNLDDLNFNIVPNPNNGIFEITTNWNTNNNANLIITDISGKIIYHDKITDNHQVIDLTNIDKGVYIVNIKSEFKNSQKKIIIH